MHVYIISWYFLSLLGLHFLQETLTIEARCISTADDPLASHAVTMVTVWTRATLWTTINHYTIHVTETRVRVTNA